MPFQGARAYVQRLRLPDTRAWRNYCKGLLPDKGIRPPDIPANPQNAYNQWNGYRDWLGTDWLPFQEARKFSRKLGIKKIADWKRYCRGQLHGFGERPVNVPMRPEAVYKAKWTSWGNWLNTPIVSPGDKKFRSFASARQYVRKLGLNSNREWREYCKGNLPALVSKPENIPVGPDQYYRDKGWAGWPDWLGTK